jgi:rubrerythrin
MTVNKSHTLMQAASLILILIIWIATPEKVYAGTLYEYIDKNGDVVITDKLPPGVKAKNQESFPDVSEKQKMEWQKERDSQLQMNREVEEKKKEKQEKIRTIREELDRAKSEEQRYRSNMNQSALSSQRHRWRMLLDEQLKVIEEKQKMLNELETMP